MGRLDALAEQAGELRAADSLTGLQSQMDRILEERFTEDDHQEDAPLHSAYRELTEARDLVAGRIEELETARREREAAAAERARRASQPVRRVGYENKPDAVKAMRERAVNFRREYSNRLSSTLRNSLPERRRPQDELRDDQLRVYRQLERMIDNLRHGGYDDTGGIYDLARRLDSDVQAISAYLNAPKTQEILRSGWGKGLRPFLSGFARGQTDAEALTAHMRNTSDSYDSAVARAAVPDPGDGNLPDPELYQRHLERFSDRPDTLAHLSEQYQIQQELANRQAQKSATKSAAELAEAHGVNLAAVTGTGARGTITQRDVKDYIAGQIAPEEADGPEAGAPARPRSGQRNMDDYYQAIEADTNAMQAVRYFRDGTALFLQDALDARGRPGPGALPRDQERYDRYRRLIDAISAGVTDSGRGPTYIDHYRGLQEDLQALQNLLRSTADQETNVYRFAPFARGVQRVLARFKRHFSEAGHYKELESLPSGRLAPQEISDPAAAAPAATAADRRSEAERQAIDALSDILSSGTPAAPDRDAPPAPAGDQDEEDEAETRRRALAALDDISLSGPDDAGKDEKEAARDPELTPEQISALERLLPRRADRDSDSEPAGDPAERAAEEEPPPEPDAGSSDPEVRDVAGGGSVAGTDADADTDMGADADAETAAPPKVAGAARPTRAGRARLKAEGLTDAEIRALRNPVTGGLSIGDRHIDTLIARHRAEKGAAAADDDGVAEPVDRDGADGYPTLPAVADADGVSRDEGVGAGRVPSDEEVSDNLDMSQQSRLAVLTRMQELTQERKINATMINNHLFNRIVDLVHSNGDLEELAREWDVAASNLALIILDRYDSFQVSPDDLAKRYGRFLDVAPDGRRARIGKATLDWINENKDGVFKISDETRSRLADQLADAPLIGNNAVKRLIAELKLAHPDDFRGVRGSGNKGQLLARDVRDVHRTKANADFAEAQLLSREALEARQREREEHNHDDWARRLNATRALLARKKEEERLLFRFGSGQARNRGRPTIARDDVEKALGADLMDAVLQDQYRPADDGPPYSELPEFDREQTLRLVDEAIAQRKVITTGELEQVLTNEEELQRRGFDWRATRGKHSTDLIGSFVQGELRRIEAEDEEDARRRQALHSNAPSAKVDAEATRKQNQRALFADLENDPEYATAIERGTATTLEKIRERHSNIKRDMVLAHGFDPDRIVLAELVQYGKDGTVPLDRKEKIADRPAPAGVEESATGDAAATGDAPVAAAPAELMSDETILSELKSMRDNNVRGVNAAELPQLFGVADDWLENLGIDAVNGVVATRGLIRELENRVSGAETAGADDAGAGRPAPPAGISRETLDALARHPRVGVSVAELAEQYGITPELLERLEVRMPKGGRNLARKTVYDKIKKALEAGEIPLPAADGAAGEASPDVVEEPPPATAAGELDYAELRDKLRDNHWDRDLTRDDWVHEATFAQLGFGDAIRDLGLQPREIKDEDGNDLKGRYVSVPALLEAIAARAPEPDLAGEAGADDGADRSAATGAPPPPSPDTAEPPGAEPPESPAGGAPAPDYADLKERVKKLRRDTPVSLSILRGWGLDADSAMQDLGLQPYQLESMPGDYVDAADLLTAIDDWERNKNAAGAGAPTEPLPAPEPPATAPETEEPPPPAAEAGNAATVPEPAPVPEPDEGAGAGAWEGVDYDRLQSLLHVRRAFEGDDATISVAGLAQYGLTPRMIAEELPLPGGGDDVAQVSDLLALLSRKQPAADGGADGGSGTASATATGGGGAGPSGASPEREPDATGPAEAHARGS